MFPHADSRSLETSEVVPRLLLSDRPRLRFASLIRNRAAYRVLLRAELLSALIGSISLIPFIISSGTGAEIEKPLAIVVVGGMVMSPIKIVLLPMVYEWVERGAERRAAKAVEA